MQKVQRIFAATFVFGIWMTNIIYLYNIWPNYRGENVPKVIRMMPERMGVKEDVSNSDIKHNDSVNNSQLQDGSFDTMQQKERIYTIVVHNVKIWGITHYTSLMDFKNCTQYRNCQFIERNLSESRFIEADAVLMDYYLDSALHPVHRDNNQVFIFGTTESLVNKRNWTYERNYFNWTMSYRTDSSVPILYGSVVSKYFRLEDMQTDEHNIGNTKPISSIYDKHLDRSYISETYHSPQGIAGKDYSSIFKGKEYSALWLVSHCVTQSQREQYVQELQKYIDVKIIGECTEDTTCGRRNTIKGKRMCDEMFTTKYKFYLSFENSLCSDYITEKVYSWFMKDIVTVVRGAIRYDKFLPKGTYVDVNDFASPKQLADYLHKLASDETEYTNILKRKDGYTVVDMQSQHQLGYCHLCHNLNNLDKHRKVISDISKWWLDDICLRDEKITDDIF